MFRAISNTTGPGHQERKKVFHKNIILDLISILVLSCSLNVNAAPDVYSIHIIKKEFKLYLFKNGKIEKVYPVALGKEPGDKQKDGDMRTPEGSFHVISIHDSRAWVHDFKDGKGPVKGAYGPWFIRLYTKSDATNSKKTWTGIGIHGTHDPKSIGTQATEGCIRMRNEDLLDLKEHITIGAKVVVSE